MNSLYTVGTDILIGHAGYRPPPGSQVVLPSVNEYPLLRASDFDGEGERDADAAIAEAEFVLGHGHSHSPVPWPQGNLVWPGTDIDDVIARRLDELAGPPPLVNCVERGRAFAEGRLDDVLGGGGVSPLPAPHMWQGTEEDLLSRIDLERTFDESFDDAMVRRTGRMRG